MPLPLFMAAGALLFGGGYLLNRAQAEEAREEALDHEHFRTSLLREAITQAELRDEALRRGLTNDQIDMVLAGFDAMNEGRVEAADVLRMLNKNGAA